MRNIEKLIWEIVPPPTREEREGFTNYKIIAGLSNEEFLAVEKRLIKELDENDDLLIGQTLVEMKSESALPVLLRRLEKKDSHFEKITWAALINDLKKGDSEMEKIAFKEFEKLEFIYAVQGVIFIDLIKFDSPRINKRIENFVDHKYDLVAHHAKMVLNYNGYADSYDNSEHKKWWEIWK
ncbi:hypothetical protein [Aquimarina sp. 2201CG5-10]|uniref:hypothetical protein n=1 Tax=Aquimarina callyspongiae TaxID=3098150 RepID=UPI002AB56F3D|nr:hypothetical protein [Aquimarina sp. 2201CG5-10]MDY8135462.1 hypothetical protein [Aquimarina sp. 2201CG5-10]